MPSRIARTPEPSPASNAFRVEVKTQEGHVFLLIASPNNLEAALEAISVWRSNEELGQHLSVSAAKVMRKMAEHLAQVAEKNSERQDF